MLKLYGVRASEYIYHIFVRADASKKKTPMIFSRPSNIGVSELNIAPKDSSVRHGIVMMTQHHPKNKALYVLWSLVDYNTIIPLHRVEITCLHNTSKNDIKITTRAGFFRSRVL